MKKIITLFAICSILIGSALPSLADIVVFNTQTKKIHSVNCPYAKKCTVNCIKIERSEAIKRGGIPCKVCGGK